MPKFPKKWSENAPSPSSSFLYAKFKSPAAAGPELYVQGPFTTQVASDDKNMYSGNL
ncbi:unnamed protein product [Acanthoscelides obtectus]|uniref:Uncharacterized protein n=1 Tax=Acanthoscelides obtectus TaxID=200917 RepID=A0A9P0L136_ACAOB|nr:unnamed protein product [Acanthoscelides obtectus]CAK1650900.1 hypothetical protein AOBTE_LOCUS16958 [Acanthoscelides obtectus]